jgi:hypothetical protein
MSGTIVSVCRGKVKEVPHEGGMLRTAIFKAPAAGPVRVGTLGLEGDAQADTRYHGGPEMALLAYSATHYPRWAAFLGRDLEPGQFGENLTVSRLLEEEVRVGDTFRCGTAVVAAVKPRSPCFKLGVRVGNPAIVDAYLDSGASRRGTGGKRSTPIRRPRPSPPSSRRRSAASGGRIAAVTMSSPAGPVLILLGLGTAAVTWGLDDVQVRSVSWPAPRPTEWADVDDLAALRDVADREQVRPGSGREAALALARRLLVGLAGQKPSFRVEEGPVPLWDGDTVLEFGWGGGHYTYEMHLLRVEGASATGAYACDGRKGPRVAFRSFRLPVGERLALSRMMEALSSFRLSPPEGYQTPETVTISTWNFTKASGPGGLLFQESWSSPNLDTDDAPFRARSAVANRLAKLLVLGERGEPREPRSADGPWIRSAYGDGTSGTGGLSPCWEALFTAVGDPTGRRNARYVGGR